MRVGHGHHVAGGVWVRIEADEAVLSAKDEPARGLGLLRGHSVGDGEVDRSNQVTENAAQVAGPGCQALGNAGAHRGFRRGDIGKAPGTPEMIHRGRTAQHSIEAASSLQLSAFSF